MTVEIKNKLFATAVEKKLSLIPIKPGRKEPALPAWQHYQTQRASSKVLHLWSGVFVDCNWAVVTGAISGVVVLDFDKAEAYERAKQEGLPDGPRVKTPRGYHCYFKHPGSHVANRTGIRDAVDVRGDGGYVLVPPSKVGGVDYRWEVSLDDAQLPDAPDWLRETTSTEAAAEPASTAGRDAPDNPEGYSEVALEKEKDTVANAPESKRNDTLNRAAFSVGTLIATGSLDRTIAESGLTEAAERCGLERAEIGSTIRSGIEAGLKEPRWTNAQKPKTGKFQLLSIKELRELPEPAPLIGNILFEDSLVQMQGRPGGGKSFLALDWGLSVATGTKWLGHETKQGSVVYVAAEGASGLTRRIAAWEATHQQAENAPFRVLSTPVNLLSEETDEFIKAIQGGGIGAPSLIIVDTLARCFGDGDENTAKDMNQFIGSVEKLRAAFRPCTVLVVHHTGQKETSRGRGSSALPGAVDTDINLSAKESVITLSCRKQKDAEGFKEIKLHRKVVSLADGATSCAILPHTASGDDTPSLSLPEAANDNKVKALDALEAAGDAGLRHDDWERQSGLAHTTFGSIRRRLTDQDLVHREDETKLYKLGPPGDGPS